MEKSQIMLNIVQNLVGKCWKLGNKKKYIIVHHTASAKQTTLDQIVRFFKLSNLVSCHYVVGKYGEIVQMVDENDRAWHAGKSKWENDINLNNCSIGIEILSDGKDFNDYQREAVWELCKDICKRNKIPHYNVLRHGNVSPDRKWDVGENFWFPFWGKYWSDFQRSLIQKDFKKR